jgi:hypothetical protein
MLTSTHLKSDTKGELCDTILKPVLVYGRESRTLTKGDGQKLRTFKELKIIYRPNRKKKAGKINRIMSNMTCIMPLK